ncbi:hypothetical protein VTN00DRAFT_9718 [Thermoascus crustaceus]|uniref:uncharacterized protein n=1 Tax=Thermoascus crustaceus TaxID=5088 RepID=UPI0037449EC0
MNAPCPPSPSDGTNCFDRHSTLKAGNWSLFTTSFSKLPLYCYDNPLSAQSNLQTEDEILRLVEEEGPFDGVVGYSGGATLAAQLIIRDSLENPWKLSHERVFRWAVFINGATPIEEAAAILLRPSNIRVRKGLEKRHPDYNPAQIQKDLLALQTRQLVDGRHFMTGGAMGITRYDARVQGTLIDIPTLHVRSPTEKNRHLGLGLMEMCEPSLVKEFFHQYDHDFPRGHLEMKTIAELIRETAEMA